MKQTKETMLRTALRLFAQRGYEAVSISDIAAALGMAKSALYKHYASKQAIFDEIVARMEQQDAQSARENGVPEEPYAQDGASYGKTTARDVAAFARAQFRYWTEDEFAADFRRMLTLEQFASEAMGAMYQQYLGGGPLGYMEDLFREGMACGVWKQDDPALTALRFYAPMHLLYAIADARGSEAACALLEKHLRRFMTECANESESDCARGAAGEGNLHD